MKFLMFMMYDVDKTPDIAQALDQVSDTPGIESVARYVCLGIPFPGYPQNTLLGIGVVEAESSEAMAAYAYPPAVAGGTVWWVPVLEYEEATAAETEKKYRG